jgi:Flp pilus assembly protein TadB
MLKSETVAIQSPMSFTGSARRIWTALVQARSSTFVRLIGATVAIAVIAVVWLAVAAWYIAWLLIFPPLLFVWRLVRRGQRKRRRDDLRHREIVSGS